MRKAGLAAAAVDILLPFAAQQLLLIQPLWLDPLPDANRCHAELKNDLNKTGEIYVHTCGMCESDP